MSQVIVIDCGRLEEAKALFSYIYDHRYELMQQPPRMEALAWTYLKHLCDALGLPYSAMDASESRPLCQILKGA